MGDDASNVVPLVPRPDRQTMLEQIRAHVETGEVDLSWHAENESMLYHDISPDQVLDVLESGSSASDPEVDDYGCWSMKLQKVSAGQRVYVVAAVRDGVVVVTVWKREPRR